MNSTKNSPAASMFEKVLRAFETRGITYSDVLARLRRLLATGASPQELLVVLRRRESTERMPEYARIEALLIEAMERSARNADPDPGSAQSPAPEHLQGPPPTPVEAKSPADEVAVDLEFDAADPAFDPRLRASELDLSVLARHLRLVEERKPARGAAVDALTRSYERAREGESVAAERAASLTADLEAAASALKTEQGKVRDIEQALAQRVASAEAARDAALAELEHYRAELQTLRESLAERDAAVDQTRQALAEHDSRIAALSRDRTVLEAALEARAKAATELEVDLRAARARADAAAAESRADRDAERPAAPAIPVPTTERPAAQRGPGAQQPPGAQRSGWPLRAIGWGVAALLIAGVTWLFAHRSPPQPAPPAIAALPNPGTVIRDCPGCPEMTVLPAGRFKQGSATGPADAAPLHWVVIGRSIAMSTNPVTVEDFGQFVTATGRNMQGCDTYDGGWKHRPEDSWQHPGFAQTGGHPVTCVSWKDAEAYANWLSAKTGHHYRLPSASEWEYAARAGTEAAQPWGSDGQGACANANVADASAGRRYPGWAVFPCDDGYVYTAPVGAFKANPFGLNDVLGNVLQWTADCWHPTYGGAPVDGSAWTDGDCSVRELRGSSWFSTPAHVRADYRDRFPVDYRTSSVGMRLVRELGP
jgi:formylglycine-generating enzyme required for sulfatase activity